MDDHDIKNIQLRSLREQIVLVPQDVVSTKYRFIPCFLFLVSFTCKRGILDVQLKSSMTHINF